jgi:cytochrome c553
MSGDIDVIKIITVIALLIVGSVQAGDEPKQPVAPGIESPGYVWNEMRGEKLLALQAKGDALRGEIAFEVCQGCHGMDALGETDGSYPRLAGQHASVIIKQLADVRAGVRDNRKMYPFAEEHVVSTQELADIALYLQGLPVPAEHGQGPGGDLERGRTLYQRDCVDCHGPAGEGDPMSFYPRVAGQHYLYLVRQMRDIRDGKRRNANPEMWEVSKSYTDDDIQVVVDYMSRLPSVQN